MAWYNLHYTCPDCFAEWYDQWDSMVDSECPDCECLCTPDSKEEMIPQEYELNRDED